MSDVILDASAIIAVIQDKPGADRVANLIIGAVVPSIIVAEVATWMTLRNEPADHVRATLSDFGFVVEPLDQARSVEVGLLAAKTRHRGLSLADRACLALAIERGLPVFTADRAWQGVEVGADIRMIR